MKAEIVPFQAPRELVQLGHIQIPAPILAAGPDAVKRFFQFFIADIDNDNTRQNYAQAVWQFFDWCERRRLTLDRIDAFQIAGYIKFAQTNQRLDRDGKPQPLSKPTVKTHLAAIRRLFDYLVTGHIVEVNPAQSVRGPKYKTGKGKTPVLTAEEARHLLDSIDTSHVVGLRDRALISTMLWTFGRVGAVINMNVDDYFHIGRRGFVRLHEKGGKDHEMPAHHQLEEYLDAYINSAGIAEHKKTPLFRSTRGRSRTLTDRRMDRRDALAMVKRRARDAGLTDKISNHTWRGTGLTIYMKHGGKLEIAQQMANHADSRTTRGYIHLDDEIQRSEIERVQV